MSLLGQAGTATNAGFDNMDNNLRAGAAATTAFSNQEYDETSTPIGTVEMATVNGEVDQDLLAILNSYDTTSSDGSLGPDGHLSRAEYNQMMVDMGQKTDLMTSILSALSETVNKVAESLMSVSKYF